MSPPNTVRFRIPPEKLAQLDFVAKALGCNRSRLLNEAVDKYLKLAIPTEQGVESTQPTNGEDADARVGSPMPKEAVWAESVPPVQADSDPQIHLMPVGPPMFFDQTAPRRKIEAARAQVMFPILGPWKTNGRLLVFLSTKGGAGVTTVACNFAVSLARESGKRALLIDLNLSRGDVALNLGLTAQYSTLNALLNVDRLDSSYLSSLLEQHSSGLFVLAGPSEFAGEDISREAICKLMAVAGEGFDYVVVDAGTTLETKHIYSFDQSAIMYVVTQIGIPELRNSNRLISKFPREGGPGIEVVINRFDPRTQEIDESHVTKALTRPARWRIPNDYAAVRRMQNTATPLSGNSPISRTILQMIRCVCGAPCAFEPSKEFSLFGWRISRS